jgi:FADH2 O2-dependent halogenase
VSEVYDIAVIGSGFAGSLLAMIARRLGRSVVLLERGRHPRFAIGESTTPLANLLLEDLSIRYDLPNLTPLCKWGTWQRTYPNIACGLKRGFTFYHHRFGHRAEATAEREEELLVAASPHDAFSDTHWFRADVDALFVCEAQAVGVDYLDEVHLESAFEQSDCVLLKGTRQGGEVDFSARFVVDATGPRGFLHRALALPEIALPQFPETEALYTHFRGVRRMEDCLPAAHGAAPPYPVDDAAVHHVFDGGWIWVLRFNNGVTSAGVAATHSLAARPGLSEGAPSWERLLDLLPTVRDQFREARAERPFIYTPRLSFRSAAIAGNRWALLPSAAGFVDPLLSTGFPLVLLGVGRLAEILEADWDSERFPNALSTYAKQTGDDLAATARLVGGLYAGMSNFPIFVSLSLLYFGTASFAEAARRLGKPELAESFLLHNHPVFGPRAAELLERARFVRGAEETEQFHRDVLQAIEPFNIAGLGARERRNWYPVEAEDFLRGAGKLGVERGDVARLLDRCGFWNEETRLQFTGV